MEKKRKHVDLPVWLADRLQNIAMVTGKSLNSVIIDCCIDYLVKVQSQYDAIIGKDDKE